jgi:glutamine cyclotransferase
MGIAAFMEIHKINPMKNILIGFVALLLFSCSNDDEIYDSLSNYKNVVEAKNYHFGDQLEFPKEVTDNAESITIKYGKKETSNLAIDPEFFILGNNTVTFNIKTTDGKTLNQKATVSVFAKYPEKNITYQIVAEYPHDPTNFVQGFQLEGNTIYESDGLFGFSQILKYTLGSTVPIALTKQAEEDFSEGCTIVGDKVYQLTWQNGKGYIYDKNSLTLLSEFPYPEALKQGWGITYDGENLIVSDGSNLLYFLNPDNPSKIIKFIGVAGNKQIYKRLNELEYHNGFIYANIWQESIILKINPDNGEVLGTFDFSEIDDLYAEVLNGIAFKGDNMLVTGKTWPKIYEALINN